MKQKKRIYHRLVLLSLLLSIYGNVYTQQSADTLNLNEAINRTLATYPTVQQSLKTFITATTHTHVVETIHSPSLSALPSSLCISPIPTLII